FWCDCGCRTRSRGAVERAAGASPRGYSGGCHKNEIADGEYSPRRRSWMRAEHGRLVPMSNSQHDGPDDQVPAIPLAPGAGVPPVPEAGAAPVPPVVTEGDTQAPVNPYVQPPANVYTQNP